MKHNFNIENYKGKYVMHCKTEEEAKEFCEYLDNIGRRWVTGRRYTDPDIVWSVDDCYYFNEGQKSGIGFAKASNYTILEWADFVAFTKSDLKDGMVVEYRNNRRRIVLNGNFMCPKSALHMNFEAYNDDLKHAGKGTVINVTPDEEYDIVKVYTSSSTNMLSYCDDRNLTLIWERKEEPKHKEMTVEEIEKELGYKIKVIADKE